MRIILAAALLSACSSSKHVVGIDAAGGDDDDDQCPGQRTYADPGNSHADEFCVNFATGGYIPCTEGTADNTSGNPRLIIAGADLNASNDFLEIDLVRGFPPFLPDEPRPPLPYTTITGEDLSTQANFATCGICVIVDVGFNRQTGDVTAQYLAKSGTVNITDIVGDTTQTPGHVAGNISNVTLVHTTINTSNNTSTPVNDGCEMTIPSLAFDAPIAFMPGKPTRARARIHR